MSVPELRYILKKLGTNFNEEEIEAIIAKMQIDEDGCINHDNFMKIMK